VRPAGLWLCRGQDSLLSLLANLALAICAGHAGL